ncbi:ABC transporter ATP-binding protein [Corynebacterium glucuronolyticum]|uniref:ABC transporter ATP-binding protein n=1 Tax=Corynebacterium glucuronolyticum TaxID=39791 RepID=UPI00223BBAF3|nr:ABC transporter ATP-binding protein [Corynebacterium glucuronolyticum]MCT1564048.1 ABC transporter ATP-binding protein [Corynebacterium glucuronolyticum]
MLEVSNLRAGFGEHTVLSGVSFTAEAPTIVGLVGPNGSGKSTLLKSLAGVHHFDGSVLFDGKPLTSYRINERVHHLSYVAQHSGAAIPLTVREVVQLGCSAGRGPFSQTQAGDEERITRALHHSALEDLADARLSELSGGQVQRAMVARAMAQQASTMLLDEPTNHLDLHHQYRLMDLLSHISTQHNTVIILAIHDLALAARYCDHLLLINGGTVENDGPPLEVLTADVLARVFRVNGSLTRSSGGVPSLVIDGAIGSQDTLSG